MKDLWVKSDWKGGLLFAGGIFGMCGVDPLSSNWVARLIASLLLIIIGMFIISKNDLSDDDSAESLK